MKEVKRKLDSLKKYRDGEILGFPGSEPLEIARKSFCLGYIPSENEGEQQGNAPCENEKNGFGDEFEYKIWRFVIMPHVTKKVLDSLKQKVNKFNEVILNGN